MSNAATLAREMAAVLITNEVDVDDEIVAMLVLQHHRFKARDIHACLLDAIAIARAGRIQGIPMHDRTLEGTHADLRHAGFTERQAESIVDAARDVQKAQVFSNISCACNEVFDLTEALAREAAELRAARLAHDRERVLSLVAAMRKRLLQADTLLEVVGNVVRRGT
jgi:hypothetical protein